MLDAKCSYDFEGTKTRDYKNKDIASHGFHNWTKDQCWRTSYGQSHCNEVRISLKIFSILHKC